MSRFDLWVIEARDESGALSFTAPQPEDIFGLAAITGITDYRMAAVIFRLLPDAILTGDAIASWPSLLDPRFRARRKTWGSA